VLEELKLQGYADENSDYQEIVLGLYERNECLNEQLVALLTHLDDIRLISDTKNEELNKNPIEKLKVNS
jgi:hypothetical protein